MTYTRPPGASQMDFANAAEFEAVVRSFLPIYLVDRSKSTTDLDFWIPPAWIEVKEKRQPLTNRWHLLPGVPESDLFVLDELSLRKALKHGLEAYFVLRDVPGDRIFLAAAWEVGCSSTTRVNRGGKGKLLLNLAEFRQVSLDRVMAEIQKDQVDCTWKRSDCVSQKEIEQV